MKKLIALALLAGLALIPGAARAQDDVDSSIVAIVNKNVIISKQVRERTEAWLKESGKYITAEQRNVVRRNIEVESMRGLIEEQLLLAEARRLTDAFPAAGKRIDKEVAERLANEQFEAGGEMEFQEKLHLLGETRTEHANKIRDEIMRTEVLAQFVLRDLTASPAELLEYYRAYPDEDECRELAQVKYRQIFIRFSDFSGDREKTFKLAAEIAEKLAKNFDFEELAQEYSNDGHGADGGLWDFQAKGASAEPAIDKALFSLELGKVSAPIETEKGFSILKVIERKEGRLRQFEEAQPLIEQELLARKRAERYATLMKRLYKENYVEIMEMKERP